MGYSDWQLDQVRVALNRYRLSKGSNGRLLPWKTMSSRLLLAEAINTKPDLKAIAAALPGEAIRRFAAGFSRSLESDRLEVIRTFLISQGYLRDSDLEEDAADLSEIRAVLTYLAKDDREVRAHFERLPTKYSSRRGWSDEMQSVTLDFVLDRTSAFFRVEETFEKFSEKSTDRKDHCKSVSMRRRGYGFAMTPLSVLHIFLRGGDPADRISYIEAVNEDELEKRGGDLFLMRNGAPMRLRSNWKVAGPDYAFPLQQLYPFFGATKESSPV